MRRRTGDCFMVAQTHPALRQKPGPSMVLQLAGKAIPWQLCAWGGQRVQAFLAGVALADLPLPDSLSTLRRSASIRLTTLAGRAAGFSFGAGRPSCLERMSAIIALS